MSDEAVVEARTAEGGVGSRGIEEPESVRRAVARALGTAPEELEDDRDLFELGLDSLALMSLVGTWRRGGSAVTFQDLTSSPTLRDWTALLARAHGEEEAVPAPSAPPRPAETEADTGPFPLATMQHAYWIGRQDGQPLGGVAAHFYVELDGHDVDPARLDTALRALVRRHGMLRAVFDEDGRQRFGAEGTPLTVRDLRESDPDEAEAELRLLRERNTHARPDVTAGDVFRAALCLLPDGRTRLQIDLDMMAGDALSLRVLLSDLRRFYESPDDPPRELGLDYRRYLAEHATLRRAERERHAAWWRERLPDLPRAPRLPTTVDPLTPVSADDGVLTHSRRLHHWLGPDDKAALVGAARRHGLTPAAALATAFAEVIAAWSDSRRFLLNLPLFDREPFVPDVAALVGDFSSSVLLDADMSASSPSPRRPAGSRRGCRRASRTGRTAASRCCATSPERRAHRCWPPSCTPAPSGSGRSSSRTSRSPSDAPPGSSPRDRRCTWTPRSPNSTAVSCSTGTCGTASWRPACPTPRSTRTAASSRAW